MSASQPTSNESSQQDPVGDILVALFTAACITAAVVIALPLVIPVAWSRLFGDALATRARFWTVYRWQRIMNGTGPVLVIVLVGGEAAIVLEWIKSGFAGSFLAQPGWGSQLLPLFGPWLVLNFLAGVLLLPIAWSLSRRRIARNVRNRTITDVVRQERIESARKRAADRTVADRIGIKLDAKTGQILSVKNRALSVPLATDHDRQAFGFVNRVAVSALAGIFNDVRAVRDWVNESGTHLVLPRSSSAVRALIIAESGSGKTVLINGLVLCALEYGWPVFVIDAKGDPADAESLAAIARSYGRTVVTGGQWNLFNGTADQVTAKLMRLMPVPDGANQHYLDEIRGVLQAVQHESAISSIDDLRERLTEPKEFVRDKYDQELVNTQVDKVTGATAGARALRSLLVALRPLERWLSEDGWSYDEPKAAITIVSLSPVDDAQARVGDLLLLDLRNFLSSRLERRDKSPVVVIVDEFPQLVTGAQDPGDTAGSLFETARRAGVGLVLATQSPAGLSNDEIRRRRALTSGAALIFGRSKDPEDMVRYAGTVLRMESSTRSGGDEQGTARAQHTFVIPPQDV